MVRLGERPIFNSISTSGTAPTSAMHVHAPDSCGLFFFVCVVMRSCATLKNDATEILYPHVPTAAEDAPGNAALNRARAGGTGLESAARDRGDRAPVGCRELRSTKYISDGQCTSINPIKELVCAGECLPAQMLPNWIGGYGRNFWNRRSSQDWRCVNDKTRTQRIQLQCQNGSTRTYKITVVTACKCKRYLKQHNESGNKSEGVPQSQPILKPKSKRKNRNSKVNGNWHELES